LGETGIHIRELIDARDILRFLFRDAPDVYVGANQCVYYGEGDSSAVFAPDVFVVKGVEKRERRTFKVWEEGAVPVWVLEVTSRSTRNEDIRRKRLEYEALGVEEYFLFDPEGDYLDPPLQGYRLKGGRYERTLPEADGTLLSEGVGLKIAWQNDHLHWWDARTGARVLTSPERAEQETLRAEQETLRASRAEQAQVEAEARASAAEARAASMEAELIRLRALLEKP